MTRPKGRCSSGTAAGLALATLLSALFAERAHATASNSASQGSHPHDGEEVALFELAAGHARAFILHGTLPIPRGLFPRANGEIPFHVVDPDGHATPAQVEIVSRYPSGAGAADGADVVEVLARVELPDGAELGDRVQYKVIYHPHRMEELVPDAAVDALLSTNRSLLLVAHDVFHNAYASDIYEDVSNPGGDRFRILRQGLAAETLATHQTLQPLPAVDGPQGTLPHLMGAHAYVTRWAGEPFFSLDLRIHNASSGQNPHDAADNPLGKLYFESLELRLARGWTLLNAIDDPFFGAPREDGEFRIWPIVAPLAGGKMHMMPAMSQFQRRLVIAKAGFETRARALLENEGLAFNRPGTSSSGAPLYSWWNPSTARYFPQRQRLPSLDAFSPSSLRAADETELAARLHQVATGLPGAWPAQSPNLGWAQPWGVADGGMVSGAEIYLIDGVSTAWAMSTAGYRLHQLVHRMYTDRQCNVLFNTSGLPTAVQQWTYTIASGTYLPIWWYNAPMLWAADPFGFSQAPTFQVQAVASGGLQPDYEQSLLDYNPIDEAHLIRYTHNAKVLVWLGNDPIAKDDLRAQAEGFRFAYTVFPQDAYGGEIPTGLLHARHYVDAYPGWGFFYGRGEAWGLDVMNAAYSTQDSAFRTTVKPWFDLVADLVEDGQSDCTGIIQSTPLGNVFNGQYRCRQSIEAAIIENALIGMRESVYAGAQHSRVVQLNGILAQAGYAMISPLVWSDTYHGPWAMIATGDANVTHPPYCTFIPPDGNYGYPDTYQTWSTFAYAYQITADPLFLQKAQEMLGSNLWTTLPAQALDNLQNRAALLALIQTLPPQ